jgi:hypothetical protein
LNGLEKPWRCYYQSEPNLAKDFALRTEGGQKVLKMKLEKNLGSHQVDVSLYSSAFQKSVEQMRAYLEEHPLLRPLVIVLKQLLYLAQLLDQPKGPISSYSLLLLVVAYLQSKTLAKASLQKVEPNIGIVFVDFFNMFAATKLGKVEIAPKIANLPIDAPTVRQRSLTSGHQFHAFPVDHTLRILDPLKDRPQASHPSKFLFLESLFYLVFVELHKSGDDPILERVFRTGKLFQRMSFDSKFR